MMRVGGAIVFDEARRLDDAHHLRIELIAIEPMPGDVIEHPARHSVPPFLQTLLLSSFHAPRRLHDLSGQYQRDTLTIPPRHKLVAEFLFGVDRHLEPSQPCLAISSAGAC